MEHTIDDILKLAKERLLPFPSRCLHNDAVDNLSLLEHSGPHSPEIIMAAEELAALMGIPERDRLLKQVGEALSEGTVIAHMMLAEDIKAVNAENDRLRDLIQTLCDFGDDCVRYSPKLGEAIKKARAELEGNNAT